MAAFVNFAQANTPSAGFSLSSGASVVAVNYMQLSCTSSATNASYPLWVSSGTVTLNRA